VYRCKACALAITSAVDAVAAEVEKERQTDKIDFEAKAHNLRVLADDGECKRVKIEGQQQQEETV
jgi:hypothetical protein